MNYRIVHRTEYAYGASVSLCHNEARLLPRDFPGQTCLESGLSVEPSPSGYRERLDFFGNRVAHFAIEVPHRRLVVTATSTVEVVAQARPLDFAQDPPWETVRDRVARELTLEMLEARAYVLESPLVPVTPALRDYAAVSFAPGRPVLEAVNDLMGRIHNDFTYDPGFSTVSTPLGEVLTHRRGVCQDFAHLAVGCLRAMGLPARYDSGYIETLPPPGQAKLVGADASHAWFAVFVPERGWVGFDPTNNKMSMEQHITVAWGRDYGDVAPLKGIVRGGAGHKLNVSVDVQNLDPPA